jgi:trk system potassium uptake protein
MKNKAEIYSEKCFSFLRERHKLLFNVTGLLLFASSCITMFLFILDIGFDSKWLSHPAIAQIDVYYLEFYFFGALFKLILDLLGKVKRLTLLEYILLGVLFINIMLLMFTDTALLDRTMVIAIFAVEFSKYTFNLDKLNLSPTLIFVSSFMIVIFTGAVLLMLPNAANKQITFLEAIFTATSATTVTGLAVLDTQKDFTTFGQTIILILIQIGGLGMMTFTSFFGLFFKGESSFQNTLLVKDYVGAENSNEAFKFVIKIVVFTLAIEFIGFLFLYFFTGTGLVKGDERFFFALFHAISAFCNAGFSTLSSGLYDAGLRHNYGFQLVIAGLIIAGGIGFPIMFNVYAYLKHFIQKKIKLWLYKEKFIYKAWVINLNTATVLYTTIILLIVGTIFFYIFERNGTIAEHTTIWGKFVTAFFGGVTPRTAGFNTVDMGALAAPTLLITMLLMWIGGSPASTAGGIKTTSFAVSFLNIFSLARGKNRIDVARRTIPESSINKAFAVIMLSFMVIGTGSFFLAVFEPDKNFLHLSFEVFSAYCTVGLSVNLTPSLSDSSRIVLIIVMFLGRVGTLNLLISLMRQVLITPYSYPKESIMTS